ncbi:hypothetical protein RhiJN_09883 [Ceratobasidium sp. AG-Ba]|nr:hypothetical protein RhiJN_09883 [Ceratobasidium sp. AG-Ba]
MGFNFYLEKRAAQSAPQRAASDAHNHISNHVSGRLSVHYEPAQPSKYYHKDTSLKSKATRYLKCIWAKVTGEQKYLLSTSAHPSINSRPVRISNPVRSTVTSLAMASFDHLDKLGHPKAPEETHISIPVTLDGAIIDHVTLPAAIASRIAGATFSNDMQSIQISTQTPPSYEQARVQPRCQPFKACQIFDDGALQFATLTLSSAEPLMIWPAPNNLCGPGDASPPSVGEIHRNVRIAPGNMIQLPSMHNARDTYMLAYETREKRPAVLEPLSPFSSPRLFVSVAHTSAQSLGTTAPYGRAFLLTGTGPRI